MDLSNFTTRDLFDLVGEIKTEIERRDKITKIQMKIDPKPRYIKPGVTGKGLNSPKSSKISYSDLELQLQALNAKIAELEGNQ